jgi:hypothetical protein
MMRIASRDVDVTNSIMAVTKKNMMTKMKSLMIMRMKKIMMTMLRENMKKMTTSTMMKIMTMRMSMSVEVTGDIMMTKEISAAMTVVKEEAIMKDPAGREVQAEVDLVHPNVVLPRCHVNVFVKLQEWEDEQAGMRIVQETARAIQVEGAMALPVGDSVEWAGTVYVKLQEWADVRVMKEEVTAAEIRIEGEWTRHGKEMNTDASPGKEVEEVHREETGIRVVTMTSPGMNMDGSQMTVDLVQTEEAGYPLALRTPLEDARARETVIAVLVTGAEALVNAAVSFYN